MDISIKKRKHESQSLEETLNDNPRLINANGKTDVENVLGYVNPKDVEDKVMLALDHAREPGAFDYTQSQTYYAVYPDIEPDSYFEVGGKDHKGLAISRFA